MKDSQALSTITNLVKIQQQKVDGFLALGLNAKELEAETYFLNELKTLYQQLKEEIKPQNPIQTVEEMILERDRLQNLIYVALKQINPGNNQSIC